jgi:hypothetical protein
MTAVVRLLAFVLRNLARIQTGQTFPRLQLYTLAEYFSGIRPKVPILDRQPAYKKAARDDGASRQGSLI